jgi:hypothetical protein
MLRMRHMRVALASQQLIMEAKSFCIPAPGDFLHGADFDIEPAACSLIDEFHEAGDFFRR